MNKRVSLTLIVGCMLSGAATAKTGQELFTANCSGCHGANANGIEGLAPSLHNPELWTKLGAHRDDYIAGVITGGMSGKIESLGKTYQGFAMPPQSFLSSADLVQITHYIIDDVNQLNGGPTETLIEQYKQKPLTHGELHKLRSGG